MEADLGFPSLRSSDISRRMGRQPSPLLSRKALNKQGKGTDEVRKTLRVVLTLGSWEMGL